jgi:hypothetical protein
MLLLLLVLMLGRRYHSYAIMMHRTTQYRSDVVPISLSSFVVLVGSGGGGGALPILIDTPNNVAEARSHAPFSLACPSVYLSRLREHVRTIVHSRIHSIIY